MDEQELKFEEWWQKQLEIGWCKPNHRGIAWDAFRYGQRESNRLENIVRRGEFKNESVQTAGQELLCAMMDRGGEFNNDGMPVIKMVDKKNGGSVTYLRYDAVVKFCNTNFVKK